jgi:hypothetical protein
MSGIFEIMLGLAVLGDIARRFGVGSEPLSIQQVAGR